jgi:hypothetical protein
VKGRGRKGGEEKSGREWMESGKKIIEEENKGL